MKPLVQVYLTQLLLKCLPKELKVVSGISQGSNLIGMKTNYLSFDHIAT